MHARAKYKNCLILITTFRIQRYWFDRDPLTNIFSKQVPFETFYAAGLFFIRHFIFTKHLYRHSYWPKMSKKTPHNSASGAGEIRPARVAPVRSPFVLRGAICVWSFHHTKSCNYKKKVAAINTKKASLSEVLFVFLGASYPILSSLPFI